MEEKFNITIPKPCNEDWNSMTPNENGRFCSVCTKGVVDFTGKSPIEIQDFFIQNQGKHICGRFKKEQVNKYDVLIPQSILRQQMSFHKAFTLALFVVMGTSFFSCKNNDSTIGEIKVVKDSVEVTHTMGIPVPPKKPIKEEKIILGAVAPSTYDSLEKAGVKLPPPPPPKIKQVKFIKPEIDSTKTENK